MVENLMCDDGPGGTVKAGLLAAIVTADQMINSMTAMRSALIEELRTSSLDPEELTLDPGDPDLDLGEVTAELACALHLPHTTAAHLLDDAHVLSTDLPATATALAEGSITYRHAQVMINHISGLDPHTRARAEKTLIPRAKLLTVSTFKRAAARERDRLDPVPLVVRHETAATGRTVLIEPDVDGMAWLHAFLPATQAHAIFNRVSDVAASLQHPDDGRTLPQLRADTLTAVMLDDDARDAFHNALGDPAGTDRTDRTDRTDGGHDDRAGGGHDDRAGGTNAGTDTPAPKADGDGPGSAEDRRRLRTSMRGIRPTVAVTVPVLTLLGADAPAELEGYGPIDPDTARDLCGQAPSFLRILTHPHTGAILGLDRDRYTIPADLKAWLRLRDEHCRFPGCARRATRCDIDHVTNWAHGGTTDQTNLIHLCRTHHRMRHRTRWQAQIITTPPGTGSSLGTSSPLGASVHWTAPSGRTYTTTDAHHERHPHDDHDQGTDHGTDPPPDPPTRFPDIPPF